MTYSPTPPRLRLRDPADVLAVIPYLLGFHPADSIVVLGMLGATLIFHARCDLPGPTAPASQVAGLSAHLASVLVTQGVNGVLLVGFGPAERVDPAIHATGTAMLSAGITVFEQLRASSGRYWSYSCSDPRCCPPEGRTYTVDDTAIVAQATLAGFVALPDRDALVHTLGPPVGAGLQAIQHATQEALARRQRATDPEDLTAAGRTMLRAAFDRYTGCGRLTDDEVAWLTVLLSTESALRDEALWSIETDGDDGALRKVHGRLWTDVVRRCDPALVVEPAVLLAYTCWRCGDGVRAGVAIDRALAVDPSCLAASLIEELLRRAVPPPGYDRHDGRRPLRRRHGRARRSRRARR